MRLFNKNVKGLSLISVLFGLMMEYFHAFVLMSMQERFNLPYIVTDIIKYILVFGTMFLFGFVCYGRDKRLFRFPIGYALGYTAVGYLFYPFLVLIANLLSVWVYIDTTYVYHASAFCGVALAWAVLISFTKQDGLIFKESNEAEGEIPSLSVRHKALFGKNYQLKIIALICSASFLCLRLSVYFAYRLLAPLTLDLEETLTYVGADLADLVSGVITVMLCFFVSRTFTENNKGAFYCLGLFGFVYSFTFIVSSAVSEIIGLFGNIDSMPYPLSALLYRFIPVALGDIAAVLVAVSICKFLSASKEKITNGLS